jgi:hypothetical protein
MARIGEEREGTDWTGRDWKGKVDSQTKNSKDLK